MKLLVATLCQGEAHQKIGAITQPEMLRYARKCGAKFTVCSTNVWPDFSVPWQKLLHLWKLLDEWDQILFLDNDALINADSCPDLFKMVPRTHVGAFKEGQICDRQGNLVRVCQRERLPMNRMYDGDYINTGVMLLSKLHRDCFVWPDAPVDDYYEQSYVNARLYSAMVPIFSLPYTFNRMSVLDPITGEQRHGSHLVHYAGSNDYPKIEQAMKQDLRKWRDGVKAETNIVIECTGGIGDIIYAEPVIRYLIEKKYEGRDDVKFLISTASPRIFSHFNYPNVQVKQGEFEFADTRETPVFSLQCHPLQDNPARRFFPYQAVHNLDFQAHAMLGDYLPREYKTPKLSTGQKDHEELANLLAEDDVRYNDGFRHRTNFVAVHAGSGWTSKTFPVEYWQKIVEGIAKSATVVLFGKTISETQGFVPVKCPENGIDLRDKLSLGGMFALIELCPKLLTNESSPLCVAGAFDNLIFLIAGPKAPELVLPYRNGSPFYKTRSLMGPMLSSSKMGIMPNVPGRVTIADIPSGYKIEDFLPSSEEVISAVCS